MSATDHIVHVLVAILLNIRPLQDLSCAGLALASQTPALEATNAPTPLHPFVGPSDVPFIVWSIVSFVIPIVGLFDRHFWVDFVPKRLARFLVHCRVSNLV